jgi:hypothetical protein
MVKEAKGHSREKRKEQFYLKKRHAQIFQKSNSHLKILGAN